MAIRKGQFKGLAFPFQKGDESFPAASLDEELIRESVHQIMLTTPGERVMRPEFGSDLARFVFEPQTAQTGPLLRAEVLGSVGRYESRVVVTDVRVEQRDTEAVVTVSYIVRATQRQESAQIVFPTH